jgi:hypothetical protein
MLLMTLALLLPGAAHAQFVVPAAGPLPALTPGTIRVQVSMQSTLPMPAGSSSDDQKTFAGNARLQIYNNAKNECATLTKTWDADCKLLTLTVSVTNQIGALLAVNALGTGVYELTPHPSAAH